MPEPDDGGDRFPEAPSGIRIGIDVGGTFTDIVADWDGGTARGKVPSTPLEPERGVLSACERIAGVFGLELPALLGRVSRFGLGTTVVTNVLATRNGRRLGLITTAGFEDLVPLARGHSVPTGGWLLPPPLLVPRERIVGVRERCTRDGEVSVPVDADEVVRAGEGLVDGEGAEALVVSFLWSFRNGANEAAARDALTARFPGLPVVAGSELAPVIREYERTQFALLNAYVAGALDWVAPLEARLRDAGLSVPIVLMHSSGGAVSADAARAVPIGLAQSGPAAGAAASVALARALHEPDLVACDMGGTSLDVALVTHGEALRRTRGQLVGQWTAMSMVDVDSVGSGGGSIAWVDALGALRVGPASAGADPGPACYGHGGADATVTDALLVLGYLDPATFLGGRMALDADAAWAACERLGARLGLGTEEAAWGVREVALTLMAKAVRGRLASRGLTGAGMALLAYGGCGPLFGADIGAAVGARCVVVPGLAGVFSAYGAATTPLRRERTRSLAARLPVAPAHVHSVCAELWDAARADLAGDGVHDCDVMLEVDMRFERQSWELTVPLHATRPEAV
ncbi:MAG TPA: hydantoinase/oxoprolinase family protein, partial [Acidimicrobiales bacterium]|nr:hydantoinase/oxoprolinase family protein [Acidimicrobiales bacterium]